MSIRTCDKRLVGAIVATASLIAVAYWFSWIGNDVACFRLPAHGNGLAIRYENIEGGDLLLTRNSVRRSRPGTVVPAEVYRFNVKAGILEKSTLAEWDRAVGRVIDNALSLSMFRQAVAEWRFDATGGQFRVSTGNDPLQRAQMVGDGVLRAVPGSVRDLIAVVTGSGRLVSGGRGWFILTGDSGYRGQHYVELFGPPNLTKPLKSLRLPFGRSSNIDSVIWADDDQYLVIDSEQREQVCVIEIDSAIARK